MHAGARHLTDLALAADWAPLGKMVDKTRDQLNAILDHFSITIDNPLSVLSQEVAKRFLASAKPADLYKVRSAWSGTEERDRERSRARWPSDTDIGSA